ncbi:MAG: HD domain-containing protein [Lachnospiraceae bacterium]|nr:HD domain-containing protein [Lachnospiraceae bacterium]
MEDQIFISERVTRIIEEHRPEGSFAAQTLDFVRKVLEPESVGTVCRTGRELKRYDMQYRYDHSLRVAAIGRRIAREEGLPEEPLVIGCLLHDVGYPECASFEELNRHSELGAEIARRFFERIGYDAELSRSICKAILIHDKEPYADEDATVFERSVRDADDIDRSDAMRLCIRGYHDIGECAAWETRDICRKRLEQLAGEKDRLCATGAAKRLWLENLQLQESFYRKLLVQMGLTEELEDFGSKN